MKKGEPWWWEKALKSITNFAANDLHIDPLTFLVITAFILSLVISLCCCFCCICYCIIRRFRKSNGNENRRGLLALMFANLEEFESLTPLIVSPSSTTSSLKPLHSIPPPLPQIKSAFKPTKEQLIKAAHALSNNDSPPLPRRPHSGKTLIVPLTASNNRQIRNVHTVAGTPDSRITSIEAGTTKSCATIPEDEECSIEDEEDDEDEDDVRTTDIDLVSIDRTYVSTRHSCTAIKPPLKYAGFHQYNPHVPIPENVPFKEKPPLYEPPAPPWEPSAPIPQRRANLRLISEKSNRRYLPGRDSPGLSSPEASSCGLESPEDTTGSISDSFIIPSESDDSRTPRNGGGAVYSLDTFQEKASNDISSIDTDAQSNKKFHLHRIEEESEHFDNGNGSHAAAASTVSTTHSHGFYGGKIPRSISQQLELMKK